MLSLARVQVLSAVCALLSVCLPSLAPGALAAGNDVAPIAQEVDAALNAANTDDAVGLFSADAVVIHVVPAGAAPRVFVGRNQIRWWLESLALQHIHVAAAGPVSTSSDAFAWRGIVAGDSLRQIGIDVLPTAFTATIDNGQISSLTMLPTAEAARQLADPVVASNVETSLQPHAAVLDAPVAVSPLGLMGLMFSLGAALGLCVRPIRAALSGSGDRLQRSM